MTDEIETYEDDISPNYAAAMISCPYYNEAGQCFGGCHEEPACQVDEPEEGWAHYLPADFDLEAHRRRIARLQEAENIRRWLAAEKRWLERPVLEEMTETGVYPINPRCPMYAKGTRFAAYYVSNGGTATSWHETEEQARAKLAEHEQFHRDFWEEKVAWKDQGDRSIDRPWGRHRTAKVSPFRDVVRIGGVHHTAAYLGVRGGPREGKGFGGAIMRWRWLDDPEGTVHETDSLWYQGKIPEDFRDRLPDNAEWVRS